MIDDRFRNFVARIARWTDEEVRRVSPTQVRHIAQLVVDGADPHYPPFDKVGFPADSVPHPTTEKLVNDFMAALKAKLAKAEQKYGFTDNWRTDDWEADCQRDLAAHVQKGDPLDVAAYAAFCWARGYRTAPPQADADRLSEEETARASDILDLIAPLSISSTWEPSERRTILRAMLAYGDVVAAITNTARDAETVHQIGDDA
jgi:hypothetical protein